MVKEPFDAQGLERSLLKQQSDIAQSLGVLLREADRMAQGAERVNSSIGEEVERRLVDKSEIWYKEEQVSALVHLFTCISLYLWAYIHAHVSKKSET